MTSFDLRFKNRSITISKMLIALGYDSLSMTHSKIAFFTQKTSFYLEGKRSKILSKVLKRDDHRISFGIFITGNSFICFRRFSFLASDNSSKLWYIRLLMLSFWESVGCLFLWISALKQGAHFLFVRLSFERLTEASTANFSMRLNFGPRISWFCTFAFKSLLRKNFKLIPHTSRWEYQFETLPYQIKSMSVAFNKSQYFIIILIAGISNTFYTTISNKSYHTLFETIE